MVECGFAVRDDRKAWFHKSVILSGDGFMWNMKNRRVVIHAGPGKTGTSAIQYWLGSHTAYLKENGIFYPAHKWDQNNVSSGNLNQVFILKEGQYRLNFKRIMRLLYKFYRSGCHTLLLSSEYFFDVITRFDKYVANAEYIVYLRNPLETIDSGYNQRVKRHVRAERMIDRPKDIDFTFDGMEKLLQTPISQRLTIKPYHPSLFVGGSIISDLMSEMNIQVDGDLQKRINSSYSFEALEFMRCFNLCPMNADIRSCLDRCLQSFSGGTNKYSLLEPEEYNELTGMVTDRLTDFIDNYDLEHLRPFLSEIKSSKQKPYKEQKSIPEDLSSIAAYIKNSDIELHGKLISALEQCQGERPELKALLAALKE